MNTPKNARAAGRATSRGALTRARIVSAADELIYVKGVNATTLDDVCAASNTSKSQLYNHFADKSELVRAALQARSAQIVEREREYLERLKSFRGLIRWRNAIVQRNALHNGAYGCPIGSMANELSNQDDHARVMVADTFAEWERLLATGLRRMQDNGTLKKQAAPEKLATGLIAALQGGYLLAKATHDMTPMEIGLDMALDHIKSFLVT